MHRSVSNVIVTLSAYLLSLWFRVPGGHFCRSGVFTFWGCLSVAFVCLGSGDWELVYWGHGFSLLGHGGHPGLLVICVVGATGATAHVSFVVSFVCEAVQGFPCFSLRFLPPSFEFISLGFLSPLGSGGVGGRTAGRGLSRVGYIAHDVAEDLLCFLFFLLFQLAAGS